MSGEISERDRDACVRDSARRELARELRRRLNLSHAYWRMMDEREPRDRHRARVLELEDVLATLDSAMRATRGKR